MNNTDGHRWLACLLSVHLDSLRRVRLDGDLMRLAVADVLRV